MFVGRTHDKGFIELNEGEEKLYRLPPMSSSNEIPLVVTAFDAYTTKGPHDQIIVHDSLTSELELTRHSNHFPQSGANRIFTWIFALSRRFMATAGATATPHSRSGGSN